MSQYILDSKVKELAMNCALQALAFDMKVGSGDLALGELFDEVEEAINTVLDNKSENVSIKTQNFVVTKPNKVLVVSQVLYTYPLNRLDEYDLLIGYVNRALNLDTEDREKALELVQRLFNKDTNKHDRAKADEELRELLLKKERELAKEIEKCSKEVHGIQDHIFEAFNQIKEDTGVGTEIRSLAGQAQAIVDELKEGATKIVSTLTEEDKIILKKWYGKNWESVIEDIMSGKREF